MIIKNNIVWFPWQVDTIKGVLRYPHDTHVIKAKRQVGKSVMSESIILKFAIEKNNSFSLYISPTLKQARKVFKELVKAIEYSSIFKKANESILEILLINGSTIQFASAEQGNTALQGYTVTGVLIIDEAAFIPDEIYYAILPTTDANESPVVIISTPRFRKGFFYETFMDGEHSTNGFHSYNWANYDTSALLDEAKLEYYRSKLPITTFKQYYLGEFCDINISGAFGDFTSVLSNVFELTPKTYAGIDWGSGSGQDETSISIFNDRKQMIYLRHFNDLDETQTINEIIKILIKYHPSNVKVETNSIGKVYYGLLSKAVSNQHLNISIEGFNTSNDSKLRIISNLQVAIQNKDIQLLDDEDLVTQFSMYETQLTKTSGKVTYNASNGYHDDIVMSTAIAFDNFRVGTYTII